MQFRTLAPLALLLTLCLGCTTAISTMQPADTLEKGSWHAGAGMDVAIPVSRIIDAVDAAATISEKYANDANYTPSEAEQRTYLEALIGIALSAPGVSNDFMLRYGFADKFDAGLRWTTSGIHVDGKYQFLDAPSGWAGSLSLGVSHHSFSGLLFDTLEHLKIDDFSRNDIEIPIIFGKKISSMGYFWTGPKYIFTKYSVDATIDNVAGLQSSDDTIHYLGGFAGAGFGYKKIYAFVEMTAMQMLAKPVILGEETDLGGIVVMPAFGLMGRF